MEARHGWLWRRREKEEDDEVDALVSSSWPPDMMNQSWPSWVKETEWCITECKACLPDWICAELHEITPRLRLGGGSCSSSFSFHVYGCWPVFESRTENTSQRRLSRLPRRLCSCRFYLLVFCSYCRNQTSGMRYDLFIAADVCSNR